jgi:hypothetical protein
VIIVAAMWTGIGWINAHSSGGSMLEPETILEVQERAFIRTRDRGTVKSERDLPKTAEIGDQYTLANGTMSWIWMIPVGAQVASWIDP